MHAKKDGASGAKLKASLSSLLLLSLLLLLIIPSQAVASVGSEARQRENPVIIMLLPASGERARAGRQLFEAAQFAASEIAVDVELLDEGADPEATLEALRDLEGRRDIAAIIGPLEERRSRVAARWAQEAAIPLIAYGSHEGIEKSGSWIYRGRPGAEEFGERLASFLAAEEIETLGVLGPRTDRGRARLATVVRHVNEKGGRVTGYSTYDVGTSDFGPALGVLVGTRVFVGPGRRIGSRRSDPFGTLPLNREPAPGFDALLIDDHHEVVARILPFLPRAGIQTGAGGAGRGVQLIGFAGWRGEGLRQAGAHGVGAIFFDTFGGISEGGQAEEFAYRFQERLDRMPTTAEAEIYDLVGMIGSGIQAIQPGERWADAALSRLQVRRSYPGVTGSWSFTEEGAPERYLRAFRVIDEGRWAPMMERPAGSTP